MKPNKNIALVSSGNASFQFRGLLRRSRNEHLEPKHTPNFELLLINDGSVDNSEAIAKKLTQKDSRIVYLNNGVNRGVCFY